MKRAQVLLLSDEGKPDGEIAEALHVGTSTVYRTKQRFVEEGLEQALSERPGRGGERKLKGQQEAMLVALACSKPPTGRRRWTLHLLADELVALTDLDSLSYETVRRRLEESEPWQMWCLPKVDAGFVAQMEARSCAHGNSAATPSGAPSSGCSPSTGLVKRWPAAIQPCSDDA